VASTTGIELGPDSCVLVSVRPGAGGAVDVAALQVIEPASWPTSDVAQTEALRDARLRKRFPRAARVVVWGLPEDRPADDAISRAGLRPITAAGFRIDAVMTPPQALARLAAARPRGSGSGAVAWLALNMHGAAIAIVRGSELLFSRAFEWSYNRGELSSKGQLLQRYSLVAHLAPELRQGIAAVRASHGVAVDVAVTCGDLPDLRSLTMPLIEELDLEVETLDSNEGLRPVGKAKGESFAVSAPAIRLACVAGLAPSRQRWPAVSPLSVAAIAIIAALCWGASAYFSRSVLRPAVPRQASGAAPAAAVSRPRPAAPAPGAAVKPATTPQASPPQQTSSNASPAPAHSAERQSSVARVEPRAVPKAPPAAPKPAPPAVTAASKPAPQIVPPAPKPVTQPAPQPAPPAPQAVTPAPQPVTRADPSAPRPTAHAGPVAPSGGASPAKPVPGGRPMPLKDPLPRLDSILIDQDRRLAILDGAIVEVGAAVGPRVVVQIDRNAVILREPSGHVVRVTMRAKPGSLS
jgi:hypothetical protein